MEHPLSSGPMENAWLSGLKGGGVRRQPGFKCPILLLKPIARYPGRQYSASCSFIKYRQNSINRVGCNPDFPSGFLPNLSDLFAVEDFWKWG